MELKNIKGIGPAKQEKLAKAGIETVSDLASADLHTISKATGISHELLKEYQEKAVGHQIVSSIRHFGPATFKVLAESGIRSLKDLADASKEYAKKEQVVLKDKATKLGKDAETLARRVANDAKSSEGRKKLAGEGKALAVKTVKEVEARSKDLVAMAQKEGERAIKQARNFQEKAPAAVKEVEAKAKAGLKLAEEKAKEVEAKAAAFVKTEVEKVKASSEQVVGRVKSRVSKKDS